MPVEEVPVLSVLERLDNQSRLLDSPSHGDGVRMMLYSVIKKSILLFWSPNPSGCNLAMLCGPKVPDSQRIS
jgi:hypothetical protein